MQIPENNMIGKYVIKYRRYRAWQRIVSVMVCIVVFCTTYALMLPAITKERETFCGFENHTHDASCYAEQSSTPVLSCQIPGAENSILLHRHNEWCYDDQLLICTLPEISAHIHAEECYEVPQFHSHTEACMVPVRGMLLCTEEETAGHTHDGSCYEPGDNLICTLEEQEGHQHAGDCFTQEEILDCGLEETQGHSHGEGCYTDVEKTVCGLQETSGHGHQSGCYTTVQTLVCGMDGAEDHAHSESCYFSETKLSCGMQEMPAHSHSEGCIAREQVLTCTQPETAAHSHSDACRKIVDTLVCTSQEIAGHSHSESCMEQILVCQLEEIPAHSHEDGCYELVEELVCGMEEGQEIPGQLICGQEALEPHIHGTDCTDASACEKSQVLRHDHEASCRQEPVADPEALVCELEEGENHTHSQYCYGGWIRICGTQEHIHELICYSDPNADVENEAIWESTFAHVTLTGNYREDLLAIAETQLGYKESTKNYIIGDDGSLKGYTRYGHWYGSPYGDWCAMFVSFCLHYAQVEEVGTHWGVRPWIEGLESRGLYALATEYTPVAGDIVFFDWNADGLSDHVGLVAEVLEDGTVRTLEGNSGNCVCYVTYGPESPDLLGYGIIPENPLMQPEEEPENPVCGLEEHTHEEGCFDEKGQQVCKISEHSHTDGCFPRETPEYICGLEEHTHEEGCFDENGQLTCLIQDHIHGDGCLSSALVLEEKTLYAVIYADSSYEQQLEDTTEITVTGMLPADAVIRAYPVTLETDMQVLCAYEIEILLPDGTVYEPADGESLNVVFQSPALEEQQDMQVYYIPEEGEPEAIDSQVTEDGVAFDAPHFSVYAVMAAQTGRLEPFTMGTLSFSYNTMHDAFIYDPAYAQFYNPGSPLGTAGSFHIVGFGTVTLNSHTNGNVLAHTLIAGNNFGTNSKNNVDLVEISYVQNYQRINANSGADKGDYLVIGSENQVAKTNNGYSLAINDVKMDKPDNIIQDDNTSETPFIDLHRVEAEVNAISANLSSYATSDGSVLEAVTTGSDPYLRLTDADNVGIYNLTSAQLQAIRGSDGWDMRGFASGKNGAIVINVDCSQADRSQALDLPKSRVYVDGVQVPLEETLDFTAGKVIWNFINASGLQINTTEMTGMIIAPGATVNINSNLNGTVVAENVNVNAESHRTDFHGKVIPSDHIDGAHIHVYKVDKNNYGQFLPGAKFTLYEWNGASWVTARENNKEQISITDGEGKVIFQNLSYNVAYRLEETQAPPGYKISTDHQYYYFPHTDTHTYPVRKPSGFDDMVSDDCIVHYYPNEESDVDVTALHLEKRWQDQQGNDLLIIPWDHVEVEITRGVSKAVLDSYGNFTYHSDGSIVYESAVTVSVYDTVIVYASEGWTKTITNLPVTSDDRMEKYTYSARELGTNYVLTPDENGIITVINKADVTYIPLSVTKHWEGEIPDDVAELTFQLYRVSRTQEEEPWSAPEPVPGLITLDASGGWVYTAEEGLIREMTYADERVTFAYFLVEMPVPEGYYPDYHGITAQSPLVPVPEGVELEVTNHPIAYTDLDIRKLWQQENGEPLEEEVHTDISVKIQQSSDSGVTWQDYGEPVQIRKQDAWQYTVQELPLHNDRGASLIYRVVEEPLEGYLSTGGIPDDEGLVQIINRRVKTTSLTVDKVWLDANGAPLALPPVDEILIQLLRSTNGGPWMPYLEPVAITAEDNWKLTLDGLILEDLLLDETYRYSVAEVTVSDLYESTVTDHADGTLTVTNRRINEATDVLVEKRWLNRKGEEFYASSGSVQVQLMQLHEPVGSQGSASGRNVNVTVKLTRYGSDDSQFSGSVYTVPQGTAITVTLYTQGSSPPQLFTADPSTPWARTELGYTSAEREGSRLTHTYVYKATSDILLIGQTNHWTMDECGGQSSYSASMAESVAYGTVTLNVANGWKHLFPDLPVHSYDEQGNITGSYSYYVEEPGGSQYSVTYTDPSGNAVGPGKPVTGGTVIVRNRLSEDTYILPDTGGTGNRMYTGTGLAMVIMAAIFLLHNHKRRRRAV